MKKFLTLLLGIALIYSCSTSEDGNGNSTTTVVPLAPSNLTGTVGSSTQINLSWTDNSTNETGFKIERKTGSGTFTIVGTTATDITTFIDTGLTTNTNYTYRIYSYNAGGNSPTYSNELNLNTYTSVTDIDGNVYQTVTICDQVWTKSNLNVSKYRNGDAIPQVTDPTAWANLTTGAWCYYNNDQANAPIYGKLYNWYAVNDPRGLAPYGFHIPSGVECAIMINCHDTNSNGGSTIPNAAGGKMKDMGIIHWNTPNTDATNSVGFTGLPGGYRGELFNGDNTYSSYKLRENGWWWCSSGSGNNIAEIYLLEYNTSNARKTATKQKYGLSVRCIKD